MSFPFNPFSIIKNRGKRKLDIVLLIIFPILATVLSLAFETNYLISTILFFGLPAAWLSWRNKHAAARAFLLTAVASLPFIFAVDYLAILNGSWHIPQSVFPARFFGVVPYEDFLWGFLLIYCIIIFYEHLLDKTSKELMNKRMVYFGMTFGALILAFFVIFFLRPQLLVIKYVYFWIGLFLFLLPSMTFLTLFPRLLSKFVKTGVYFLLVTFLFEITALQLGQWNFPSTNFIGWVELFGLRMPFEEFFFFIILTAVTILCYYEFFDDDRK